MAASEIALSGKKAQFSFILKALGQFNPSAFSPSALEDSYKKVGNGLQAPRRIGLLFTLSTAADKILQKDIPPQYIARVAYSVNKPARLCIVDRRGKRLAHIELLSTSPTSQVFKRQQKLLEYGTTTKVKHLWILNFTIRKLKEKNLIQLPGVNTIHIHQDIKNSKFIVYKPGAKDGTPLYYGHNN